jgi:hypothetical protein
MTEEQARFYIKVINLYIKKEVPENHMNKMVDLSYIELSLVEADNLSLVHAELMETLEKVFAKEEDFLRAGLMRDQRNNAFKIFEARQKHLDKLKEIRDKKDIDE